MSKKEERTCWDVVSGASQESICGPFQTRLLAILRLKRRLVSLEALLRPDLLGVIKFPKGRRALGKLNPRQLSASINVDIGSNGRRVVQRSDADEPDLGSSPVVTPNRNPAFAAAVNVVRTISTGNRDGFQSPTDDPYGGSFDDRIDDKCAAGVPLTIHAVAAMHADRCCQKFVAHLAAGTTAPKFLSHPVGFLFHV